MATTKTNRKSQNTLFDASPATISTTGPAVRPPSRAKSSYLSPAAAQMKRDSKSRLNPAAQVLASQTKKANPKSRLTAPPAMRTGRQFTVGSIGQNGLIYLRYLTRLRVSSFC